jgi:predicted TIM-barrel fold metal-dependent hydrolase
MYKQKKNDVIMKKLPLNHPGLSRASDKLRIFNVIRSYFEKGIFQGIKLYPALGYFPFDRRLKPVYDLALEFDLPVISHVIRGAVYYRGPKEYSSHPYTGKPLDGKKPEDFTAHFTHPLNFEILLNPSHLSKYWEISQQEAAKYSNLKICLGHFGGEDEWRKFLENPWIPEKTNSLDINNWRPTCNPDSESQFSWFSICRDLMRKYPNVYADISYTLAFEYTYPLLKVVLETDEKVRERTLFGTDFYVVSKASSERKIAIKARAYLGNDLFTQIATINPVEFLSNKLAVVPA